MANITLDGAARRAAKRVAANQELKRRGMSVADLTGVAEHKSTSQLTLEQLDGLLAALGLSPDQIVQDAERDANAYVDKATNQIGVNPADATAAAQSRIETAARIAEQDGEGEDEGEDQQPAAPVAPVADPALVLAEQALDPVKALASILAPGVFDGLRASVSTLARRAIDAERDAKAAQDMQAIRIAPVADGEAPRRHAIAPASQVFGLRNKTLATLNLELWASAGAPRIDRDFLLTPDLLAPIVRAVRKGQKVWLYGPAGTGKTSLAREFAARTGREFFRYAFNRHTEPVEMWGAKYPDGAGGTAWHDGPLTKALRTPGAVILLDEPCIARPGTLATLQTVLDHDYVTLESGERVDVAPGVIWFAADNTNGTGDTTGLYADTQAMNAAFKDRFAVSIFVDFLPVQQEAQALAQRTGIAPAVATALVRFADTARKQVSSGALTAGVGFRRLLAMAEQLLEGATPKEALALCVLNPASPEDLATLTQVAATSFDHDAIKRILSGETLEAPSAAPVTPGEYKDPRNARAAQDFA